MKFKLKKLIAKQKCMYLLHTITRIYILKKKKIRIGK
jgi:hypothetical protein